MTVAFYKWRTKKKNFKEKYVKKEKTEEVIKGRERVESKFKNMKERKMNLERRKFEKSEDEDKKKYGVLPTE